MLTDRKANCTMDKLTGTVDWYTDERGFGVIRGDDGREYFVHFSVLPTGQDLLPGQRVSFRARPRRSKSGMEAYDPETIRPNTTVAPPIISRIPTSGSPQATRDAADEALRLKRERKKGTLPPRKDDLLPGARVNHAQYGSGEVVLSAADTVSVRFDHDKASVRDLPRSSLALVDASTSTSPKEPGTVAPALSVSARLSPKRSYDIGAVVQTLLRDAQEIMAKDGFETEHLYTSEDPLEPEALPQHMDLDPLVAAAFVQAEQIESFYSHQIEARRCLLEGRHLVIATPTASGKTEGYNPTILEALLREPEARALYLFPLVALGFDQADRLRRLNEALPAERQLKIGILNSFVSPDEKKRTLRDVNRVVVTTPDSLHYILLPKPYHNWSSFFRNLRYVVLDEAHCYKGVFGANMGNIVRRLLIRCQREGNRDFPQIIISSATVRDPVRMANQLTGLDKSEFAIITKSGAPQPRRHLLALPQDAHDVVDVAGELLDATTLDVRSGKTRSVRTIVFLRSIDAVKQATEQLRASLRRSGRSELAGSVADFYADKADKMDVFVKLRQGEVRCLFTTNALMAGIDIGSLDVAVVKNFPGLVMDARQMFGRAGRAGEGAAIFLANRANPFDRFYLEHPSLLFHGQSEDVIANPENPYLLAAHIKCASQTNETEYNNHEGPLSGEWTALFGETGQDLLDILVSQGQLRIQGGRYHLLVGNPHQEPPLDELRSSESVAYRLKTDAGMLLEEKRRSYAYRDAHLEAIFWHNGQRYKVIDFDEETRSITCRAVTGGDIRTKGVEDSRLQVIEQLEAPRPLASGIQLGLGKVKITTTVSEYLVYQTTTVMRCRKRSCRFETPNLETFRCARCGGPLQPRQIDKIMERRPVPQPPVLSVALDTQGSWLEFSRGLIDRFDDEFWPRWLMMGAGTLERQLQPEFEFAVHSVKHALLKVFPERIRCDESDIGGLDLPMQGGGWVLHIYDNFMGGLGLAEALFDDPETYLSDALRLIERCDCEDDEGCLVCLKYFRCRKFNASLSKLAGRYLLQLVLGLPTRQILNDLADYVSAVIPAEQIARKPYAQPPATQPI
jgi:DEAD/DEAH box helicase domain-containing protein